MRSQARIERAGDGLLRHSPFNWIKHSRRRRRLAALAYHGVHDAAGFEGQLAHLQERCNVVSLDCLHAALRGERALPERAALITFDDGDRSILEAAAPILHRMGLPAAAFVITDLIGGSRPPWWIEVEEAVARGGRVEGIPPGDGRSVVRVLKRIPNDERLAAIEQLSGAAGRSSASHPQLTADDLRTLVSMGVAVGSHTASHPLLPNCSRETVESELARSLAYLRTHLDQRTIAFAYPNGDEDPRVRAAVASAGYDLAFSFDHRLADLPPRDQFSISRLRVDPSTSLNRFDIILSGLHPAIHHRVGRT